MLSREVDLVLAKMQERWPRWQPTDGELAEWSAMLAGYDYERALEAMTLLFRDECYNTPKPGRFRAKMTVVAARAVVVDDKPPPPLVGSGVFIRCIKAPPNHPEHLGLNREMEYRGERPPEAKILADAKAAADCLSLAGGKWEVVEQGEQG